MLMEWIFWQIRSTSLIMMKSGGPDTGTVFYNCNLKHIKINDGLREDGSDRFMFNPKEYFF